MNQNKNILVTGGTGFVGRALVKRLFTLGYNVRVISRQNTFSEEFKNFMGNNSETEITIFQADIRDSTQLEDAFLGIDYVFHVAALVNSVLPKVEFEKANVQATENICKLAYQHKIKKLIYISTCDVFGLPKNNQIFTENSPFSKWNEPYPDTKIDATNCVKNYTEKGLNTTIIYPGWIYGPGDKAFIPSVLEELKSGFMPIWDKGKLKIGFIYIDDLIEAMVITLSNSKTDNEDFIILDDNSQTNFKGLCEQLGGLYDLKFKAIGLPYFLAYGMGWFSQKLTQLKITKTPMMSTNDVKSFGYPFQFSTQKASDLLNWQPKTKLIDGLNAWKTWYLQEGKL